MTGIVWAVATCPDRDEVVVAICQSREQAERLAAPCRHMYATEIPVVTDDPPHQYHTDQVFQLDGTSRTTDPCIDAYLDLGAEADPLTWNGHVNRDLFVQANNKVAPGWVRLNVTGTDHDTVIAKHAELAERIRFDPAFRDPDLGSWGSEDRKPKDEA